ncbi:MAG TPA: glutaredoxin family protein [Parcubacteria group bacterium]|jgi:glutaredoxin-like YruB-family protein|nr:glutaredoxin family protein [Parcubacteria group bacterium]
MKKVTIYSTPTCHFCNMAKEYFDANGVTYESFDVSVDSNKRAEMMEKTGQLGVPVIEIEDKIVIGFNKPKLAELLGLGGADPLAA